MDLKNKIRFGRLTFGSWITLREPAIAEILAKAGFDWLVIDMEHSSITLDIAQDLVRVIELAGVAPLVRVGCNDVVLIKRVMDLGAYGVIVPMVNNRDDAEKAISAVYYPPKGIRGVGLTRAQGYGLKFEEYRDWISRESPIIIVQVEHIKAIENLEEILSVKGVDASIIGPYDLSGSLGFPGDFNRREVIEALNRYEKICKKLKKPMGLHVVFPDPKKVLYYVNKGYSLIAIGLDTVYLGLKCSEVLSEVKGWKG